MLGVASIGGLLAMAACTGRPAELSKCPDAPCRQKWIVDHWESDRTAARAAVAGLEDPIERITAISRLIDLHPEQATELCRYLPPGLTRTRCETVSERPHLWSDRLRSNPVSHRQGGRPRGGDAVPSVKLVSALAGVKRVAVACSWRPDRSGCISRRAINAAVRGDAERAAGICLNRDDGTDNGRRWLHECLFKSAEVMVNARGPHAYRDSIDLCLLAGPFVGRCLAHVTLWLAHQAPEATSDAKAWKPMVRAARFIEAAWADRDPDLGRVLVERFWSEAMGLAYASSPKVTGDPLDGVPPSAVEQVRGAAAVRYVQIVPDVGKSLEADINGLEAALDRRAHGPIRKVPQMGFIGTVDLWPFDEPGDAERPAVIFDGSSRRTVSPDRSADLAICILEAAARVRSSDGRTWPLENLLDQGLEYPDEAVRWTARRLKAQIASGKAWEGAIGSSGLTSGSPAMPQGR